MSAEPCGNPTEAAAAAASPQMHRLTRIRGLLAGELLDTSALDYEFAVWHLALIIHRPAAGELDHGASAPQSLP